MGEKTPIRLSSLIQQAQPSPTGLPEDILNALPNADQRPSKSSLAKTVKIGGTGEVITISDSVLRTKNGRRWGDALDSTQAALRVLVEHQNKRFDSESRAAEEPFHLGIELGATFAFMLGANEQFQCGKSTHRERDAEKIKNELLEHPAARFVTNKRDGVSLADIFNSENPANLFTPSSAIDYFFLPMFVPNDEIDENGDQLKHGKEATQARYAILPVLVGTESFEEPLEGMEKKAQDNARQYIEKVTEIQDMLFEGLFKEGDVSERSYILRQTLRYPNNFTIALSTFLSNDRGYEFFRATKKLISEVSGDDKEGALRLLQGFYEILEMREVRHEAFTIDEIDEIFPEEMPDDSVEMSGITRQIHTVFSKSSQREYEIGSESIDWKGFLPAVAVKVRFPHYPKPVGVVELMYGGGEEGAKKKEVRLVVYGKEEYFDWSILDDPQSAPDFLTKSLVLVSSVMNSCAEEAGKIQAEKRKVNDHPVIESPKPRKYNPHRRKSSQKSNAPWTNLPLQKRASMDSQTPTVFAEEAQKGKGRIIMPDEVSLRRMMKKFSPDDQEIFIKKLLEFQNEGRGNMTWMVAPNGKAARTEEGEGVYKFTCSGKNGGKKGLRGYFVKVGYLQNGEPVFELKDLEYRGKVSYENGLPIQ